MGFEAFEVPRGFGGGILCRVHRFWREPNAPLPLRGLRIFGRSAVSFSLLLYAFIVFGNSDPLCSVPYRDNPYDLSLHAIEKPIGCNYHFPMREVRELRDHPPRSRKLHKSL